ncbi:hypothetical protein WMY93_023356 [Mugilogobius chulae]|uniref:Gypsy retrotransposon integrase-like protein 1 n=1 Tax=Mugilogobius chulae TaxID=88201 RepID=A0AAW0N8Z4_9GOBI
MGDTAQADWKVKDMIEKFDNYCSPTVNETVERYKFFTRNQGSSESIDGYVTELKLLAKTCNFGTLRDSLIRDRIVCGINNTSMRERLLRERAMTLDACIQLCRAAELSRENCKAIAVMYNGSKVKPLGKCKVKLRNPRNQKLYQLEFQVVDRDCTVPLIGKRASEAMKLIKVHYENIMAIDSIVTKEEDTKGQWTLEQIKTDFADVFTGDGCLEGEYRMEVDTSVKPVQLPKRRVPVAMMKPLKEELQDLERREGFWHVRLAEESSYLTTFSTPFGRYRWLRMPMGISPAPEVFQRKLTQALDGLPGLYIIADDVLITGQGESQESAVRDHDTKLRQFLERCKQKNIKLNPEKFKLRQSECTYIGHRLTANGLKVDPDKVRAIEQMPRPTDVKAVQRLLGMANYLAKFCPHLSDQCEVLRQLTHKDTEWEWTEQHENAFVKLKETIADAPVLKYYSPEDDLVVQCDASDTGLGAALMQTGKPIAFASRALTQTERGYAQIEKEFLAMVFSVEKFHQYTYGRKVTVQSDHKPLETIVRKPLLSAPKRLQRMMLRIQKYDLNVVYVPGKDMLLADTLSRAYLPECSHKDSVEAEVETVNMVQHLPISSDSLSQIRTATKDDKTLQTVIKMMQQGWPSDKRAIPPEIRPYFSFQDELSHQDGIVFKGERAVIPFSLQKDITSRLHSSHLGAEGCLRRARECVFWIGMNDHIKTHIARCSICRSVDDKQQKETLRPHEMPNRPWAKVGVDLFQFDNKDYHVTVDYYSNYWEIDFMPDTKSTTVIKKLKAHFARYGIPNTVVSDNGPQYSSQEFKRFSQLWEFEHKTSSPGFPQSNGKAESAVKTAKRLLYKAKASGQDPYLALLDHRNTPSQGLDTSPAQRLLSRRTGLCSHSKLAFSSPK